jgi:hypothetical protein
MSINNVDLSCRDGDLFCVFCGAKTWHAAAPDELEACAHFVFSYGQGEFQMMAPILLKALQHLHIMDKNIDFPIPMNNVNFQKTLVLCSEVFANFMVFSEDAVSDLGITAIAEYPIKYVEKSSSLIECIYDKPKDAHDEYAA